MLNSATKPGQTWARPGRPQSVQQIKAPFYSACSSINLLFVNVMGPDFITRKHGSRKYANLIPNIRQGINI